MGFFDIVSGIADIISAGAAKQKEKTIATRRRVAKEHGIDYDEPSPSRSTTDARKRRTDAGSSSSAGSTKKGLRNDRDWICIGPLKTANLTPYNHCVGLYRHVIAGKTMYVGRAIELDNGGFRKRLSDYRRESNSARKHLSGRTINEHLDEIITYILVVGDTEEAVEETKRLEGQYIAYYNYPEWNKQLNI